jgi:SAM-dependent methyltransferase
LGVRIPCAPELTRKIAALENRRGRGDVPALAATWDAQYRDGRWALLWERDEIPRYSVICGYIQWLAPNGRVLDVGCGEGVLLHRLGADNYGRYVGIDLSGAAVERAAQRQHERSLFIQADAQTYVPNETFDAMVFNEVLYYFDDPLVTLRRYCFWLNPGGVFITSLYANSARSCEIGRAVRKAYPPIDAVELSNAGKRWIVSVFTSSVAATSNTGRL